MKVSELIKHLQDYCDPNDLVIIPAEDDGYREARIDTSIKHIFIGRKETRYKGKYLCKFGSDNETIRAVLLTKKEG
jgi:hypothetical protein